MKNVAITLPEDAAHWAKVWTAKQDTNILEYSRKNRRRMVIVT